MIIKGNEYYAGLFDGEGSIGVYACGNGRKNLDTYWSPKIAVCGCYKSMIENLYKFYRVGNFSTQKRQAISSCPSGKFDSKLGKQGWKWYVSKRCDIKFVLTQILPFLEEKKEQALIMISFLNDEILGEKANQKLTELKQINFPADGFETNKITIGNSSESNSKAKLNFITAQLVRARFQNGETQISLAKELDATPTIINRIVLGLTYKNPPSIHYTKNDYLNP